MKVLLLGAGASKAAGYPLASDLIAAIEMEAANAGEVMLRNAWNTWDVTGQLQTLLSCTNPEVILSVPDLCEAARNAEDASTFQRAKDAFERGADAEGERINQYWESPERAQLTDAITARARFLDCLHWYFAFKHYQDAKPEGRRRREYLHRLLTRLAPGDVVVTFNWDTAVERTLGEQGRWNPITGYGFEHELFLKDSDDEPAPLPADVPCSSEVAVLKLHGCFGWHPKRGSGQLYFDSPYFLDEFDFHYNGQPLRLIDPVGRRVGPPEAPVLAYPSFLKQLRGVEMQRIWALAGDAFRNAARVEAWGYSLPESDSAARVLLNVHRGRIERHEVSVAVHAGQDSHDRWCSFLGAEAQIDDQTLG